MTVQPSLFAEILALWPDAQQLASDMDVPLSRARQWINRGYIRDGYWLRLIDVVEQRHRRIITCRQLVEASTAARSQGHLIGGRKAAETRSGNREGEERGEAA